MPRPEIEEFARRLVSQVRDRAISDCDVGLQPDARSVGALRWRHAGVTKGAATDVLVPDCVDAALHFLLWSIDEGLLRLQYVADDGTVVDLGREGSGELAGWYWGEDGWRVRYSQQRLAREWEDMENMQNPEQEG